MTELTTIANHSYMPSHAPMSVLDLPPSQMVDQITEIANLLSDIIDKKKMYSNISGNKYVTVDGWTTLGSMLNVMVHESEVHQIEGGWYAKVNLVTRGNNTVVSTASAICTRDEASWKNRPSFSLRSMAVTRATGKAYRLAFSWIINLAGYTGTPAEEMEEFNPIGEDNEKATYTDTVQTKPKATKTTKKYDKKNSRMQAALYKILEERSVPFEHLDNVGNAMHGKDFNKATVDEIIKEVVKGQDESE